jgi:apolipoprotein D and lipocalin family protein
LVGDPVVRALVPVLLLILPIAGMASGQSAVRPAPITGFELTRYLGRWYEIARLPNPFEKGLVNVTATYSQRDDGLVKVVNEGYKDSRNGKHSVATGRAKFVEGPDVARLKVTFFWPFYGDYRVVELDREGYGYALVTSGTKYLWILSRAPALDRAIVDRLLAKAAALGYSTTDLIMTPQDW